MLKKIAKPISHILLVTLLALFSSKAVCSQFLDSFDFHALKSRSVTQDGNQNSHNNSIYRQKRHRVLHLVKEYRQQILFNSIQIRLGQATHKLGGGHADRLDDCVVKGLP